MSTGWLVLVCRAGWMAEPACTAAAQGVADACCCTHPAARLLEPACAGRACPCNQRTRTHPPPNPTLHSTFEGDNTVLMQQVRCAGWGVGGGRSGWEGARRGRHALPRCCFACACAEPAAHPALPALPARRTGGQAPVGCRCQGGRGGRAAAAGRHAGQLVRQVCGAPAGVARAGAGGGAGGRPGGQPGPGRGPGQPGI